MEKRKWSEQEIKEYRRTHGSVFYCNRDDANLFVRKAYGIGFTFNWANPVGWILLAALILLIVLRKLAVI